MMFAVLTGLMLLVLAATLKKEVMRKVRRSHFQKTLTEEALPNFKSSGD